MDETAKYYKACLKINTRGKSKFRPNLIVTLSYKIFTCCTKIDRKDKHKNDPSKYFYCDTCVSDMILSIFKDLFLVLLSALTLSANTLMT